MQGGISDAEGEQRWNRRLYLMTEVGEPSKVVHAGLTTGGDYDEIETGKVIDGANLNACPHLNAKPSAMGEETADDGLRVLSSWKHTMIILHHKRHAMALEPDIGIALVEAFHEAFHQTMATGIHLAEVADLLEGIGAVATATA